MNKLYIGFNKEIELPANERRKKSGYLFLSDDIPTIADAIIFDPRKHSFNPLEDIDYRKAREIADVLYTVYPQGENTLTVRNGKRALLKALLEAKRLDAVEGDEEVQGMVGDLLASPVLRRVLCSDKHFSFNPRSVILARINRAELGEFDALVLGLLLIAQFKGQIILSDLGFYGRDAHASLIRQERLIAGVNFLDELPEKLRQAVLLIPDKVPQRALHDDAVELAKLRGLVPQTNEFNDFVREAME